VPGPSSSPVAVAVADAGLRECVLRLAAVAGVTAAPVPIGDLATGWGQEGAVVVDAAVALAGVGSPERGRCRLLVVTDGPAGIDLWQAAVHLAADAVAELPRDEQTVATWLARSAQPCARGRLVACVGARGGAGSTTLAAAAALAGAGQHTTLLVDLDPLGGGIDLVLGTENVAGARWDELAATRGTIGADALTGAVPAVGSLRVLSCTPQRAALPAEAVEAVLAAALVGHELVVADLPCAATAAAQVALSAADLSAVVVPADVRSVTAAAAAVADLAARCEAWRMVVRHPGPGDLRPRDVAAAVGLDAADLWEWDRRTARLVDTGGFARGWRRTSVAGPARRVVAAVGGAA
jgi:secretion/DNA translocation related CpaE-like protein